jgi:hypothetical protein
MASSRQFSGVPQRRREHPSFAERLLQVARSLDGVVVREVGEPPVLSAKVRGPRHLGRPLCALAAGLAAFALLSGAAAASIPRAAQYDSLLVLASDPNSMLLGTNVGLFRSTNGGQSWDADGFAGKGALSLVRAGSTIFVGGNGLFADSRDRGRHWHALRPKGLPDINVRDLAVDPSNDRVLYAVLATGGLYRSTDGGAAFGLLSLDVGPMIWALVDTSADLIAGDVSNGIYLSDNGRQWRHTAGGMVMGLAVRPHDPKLILASSFGIASSSDGGLRWATVLKSKVMFGPVAWVPGTRLAYAVGYSNGSLWRSNDDGKNWERVT